jgi:hypothetical protein
VPELVVSCFAWAGGILKQSGPSPTVEAWNVAGGKLLWWPDGSLLWRWSRGMVELLWSLLLELSRLELWAMTQILLLLWST